jgi:predicted aldo/keto reductase-like oxidoreductase
MKYLKWNGDQISMLGYGCMRFKQLPNGEIDESLGEELLDIAYNNGVNYFDTAMPYLNGKSEAFVGKVLNKYLRESYFLATKLTLSMIKSEDVITTLDKQLKTLQKDYIDFYLLHALNKNLIKRIIDENILTLLLKWKKEGKIRRIGFSFHDDKETFFKLLDMFPWDFVQIQFNYIDKDSQQGMEGYYECEKRNIPIIVMEPVKGGKLANFNEEAMKIFKNEDNTKSAASYAIRFVSSFKAVKVILSGMNEKEQVLDNLKTFENITPLTKEEFILVNKVKEKLKTLIKVSCTSCKYCMPCPNGVDIPANFNLINDYTMYKNKTGLVWPYSVLKNRNADYLKCIDCKECITKCPQAIDIPLEIKLLKKELQFLNE